MIDQIDEPTCEDFDNGIQYADRRLLNHLTWKVRDLIDAVNNLETNKLSIPTKEELDKITEGLDSLRKTNSQKSKGDQ